MATKSKADGNTGDLPLYPTRSRVMHETGFGVTTLDKLEREGLLRSFAAETPVAQ